MEPPEDPSPTGPAVPPHIRQSHREWNWELAYENDLGGQTWRLEGHGSIRFLKLAPRGVEPSLETEARRMQWAIDHLPVPVVLEHGVGESQWLLTEGLAGEDATAKGRLERPRATVEALAHGLRLFHTAPVKHCGFSSRVDVLLGLVERRLQAGLIDPQRDFHPEHRHFSARAAFDHLVEHQLTEDNLVVCHGDYCFPNAILQGDQVTGFVDLGEMGVADRWWDLAVATWSTNWNVGPGYTRVFLDAYGIRGDRERMEYYRLLYDLVS